MLKVRSGICFGLVLTACLICAAAALAQETRGDGAPTEAASPKSRAIRPAPAGHHFLDRANLALFAGVAAVRALDFTSTEHFRERGNDEVLLTNRIVDNKPLFAGIEAAGFAASVAMAYWLHRAGHHRIERWVSVVHIGVAGFGDIHNYTLGRNPAAAPPAP